MMDPQTGLLPGQSWNVAAGPLWQARLCRAGRAHVIGRELAGHPEYGPRYGCLNRTNATEGNALFRAVKAGQPPVWYVVRRKPGHPGWTRPRPWHTFERACRAARMHSRMVIAAKRQEQGGE